MGNREVQVVQVAVGLEQAHQLKQLMAQQIPEVAAVETLVPVVVD